MHSYNIFQNQLGIFSSSLKVITVQNAKYVEGQWKLNIQPVPPSIQALNRLNFTFVTKIILWNFSSRLY